MTLIEEKASLGTIDEIPTRVQTVLGRAIVDEEFRDTLFDRLDIVAKEYELSEIDLRIVKNVNMEEIEELAEALNSKIIKAAAAIIFCA